MDIQKYREFREELKKRSMNIYEIFAWEAVIYSKPNTWGGKREGAGRKKQGITKKVSINLTEDEWNYIERSGAKTVGEFIKCSIRAGRETGVGEQSVVGEGEGIC